MNYGIITARGGSKSIKKKNLSLLDGKPLLYYTITEALKSDLDEIYLSSDDDEIIKYASQFEINIIRRPIHLASDEAKSIDVIKHVISELNSKDDNFCLLQPTSPLRNCFHINEAMKLYQSDTSLVKSLVSVVQLDHNYNPDSLMCLSENGYLLNNNSNNNIYRRQDKPIYFARNGAAIYIFNSKDVQEKLLNGNILKFEMEKLSSIDIDTHEDLKLANIFMSYLKE
ncbi:acylneuraminate cytidylyltransferase family protein [Flavobacteriaceae bacterium]|nr:acylneuraminate cytidylyltransferase family protein [Flavobacteriaceae bacterium]